MDVVGDDEKTFMLGERARHFFGRRADIDEQRTVVRDELCGPFADALLLIFRQKPARFIGDVFDARR